MDGEVIGINTAILGNAQGIGFAIPINRARRIVDDLIRHGEVQATWLGMWLQELTPALRQAMGSEQDTGVLVSTVFDGTPRGPAGVHRGDIVVSLDGTPRPLASRVLRDRAQHHRRASVAKLALDRSGKKLAIEVRRRDASRRRARTSSRRSCWASSSPTARPQLAQQVRRARRARPDRDARRAAQRRRGARPAPRRPDPPDSVRDRVDDRVALRKAIPEDPRPGRRRDRGPTRPSSTAA